MRARNLKPGFFKNYELADAGPIAQLLFQGLWLLADKEGRLKDQPRLIKAEIFPYYEADVNGELTVLARLGHIRRYVTAGIAVIEVCNFKKHQSPHHTERASDLPAPDPASPCISTPPEINREVTVKSPLEHGGNPSDSLIPDSPNHDSLIPDSLTHESVPSEPVALERATDRQPDPVHAVFAHWQEAHRKPRAKLDEKRRALIRKALKHYSEADLCQAISGYLNSPHHMGTDPKGNGTAYDSIELFLRDSQHIDAGLRFYAEPPRTDLSATTRRNVAAIADWKPPELRNAGN